jgi:hypothetical protein
LLVLDGLEPLQNPPGPQEGRLREPSLQALLREIAAYNTGLCVITTRTGSRRYCRPRAHLSPAPQPGTAIQRCGGEAAPSAGR